MLDILIYLKCTVRTDVNENHASKSTCVKKRISPVAVGLLDSLKRSGSAYLSNP